MNRDNEIYKKLLTLSGNNPEEVMLPAAGLPQRKEFKQVLLAFQDIQKLKGLQYGDYIENILKGTPALLVLAQSYSEVKRKWVRLDSILKDAFTPDPDGSFKLPGDEILDTLSDLGVYSALLIDLLFELNKREGNE